MGDTRKVTLAEVARNAGVSLATASKVINERAGVNAETRQRVLSSARALGFQPKHAPALPPIPVNKPVGLLVSDLTAPSSSQSRACIRRTVHFDLFGQCARRCDGGATRRR